jgi:hypothetical protein
MEQETTSGRDNVFKLASLIEKVTLLTTLIGLVLNYQNVAEGKTILLIGLAGTTIIWFVLAFKPVELFNSQQEADEFGQWGFSEMLALIIVPRILWISSALTAFGVFAFVADFGNDGYLKGLIIGGFSISLCSFILLISLLMGVKKLRVVLPILFRALPVLMLAIYIVIY